MATQLDEKMTLKQLRDRAEKVYQDVLALKPQVEELEKTRIEMEAKHEVFLRKWRAFRKKMREEATA